MRKHIGPVLLLIGMTLALQGGAQQATDVQISITTPTDGFITLSPKLTLQGAVQAPEGTQIDLVLVSVNGKAQKVELKPNGSFEAEVELEYFGENFISATAITDTKQIGSARISVYLQRRVLFFDDFEGASPRPEWAPAVGDWVIDQERRVYTTTNWEWNSDTTTYVKTVDSTSWKDYAVEVDILDGNKEHYGWQSTGIIVRAKDDTHKVLLWFQGWNQMGWYIMRNNSWTGPINAVSGGLATPRARIRVEVVGNTFTAYVNGVRRTSYVDRDNEFPQGMPGLYIYRKLGASFDNFKVESLEEQATSAIAAVQEAPPIPDWELIRTQLSQLAPRLQDLDVRLNTLQSELGQVKVNLPQSQDLLTPSDLTALYRDVDSLEELLQRWGQDKRVETLQGLLGEQMVKVKRWGEDIERMKAAFEEVSEEAKSAEVKAEAVAARATLGVILGAAGAGLALLVMLRALGGG